MELIIKYWPLFMEGATTTILLSFFSVVVGVGCGTLMALARLSSHKVLSNAAKVYIDTVLDLNDFLSGVIAVSVNTTAYIAEIIRSGIQSVDKGQMEAARSMGMPKGMAMRQIILPQAMKNILPAIGNEFATLIKETSIVSLIGIHDLMYSSDTVRGATFTVFIPLLMTAFLYFVMTTTIAFFMDKLERKLQASD